MPPAEIVISVISRVLLTEFCIINKFCSGDRIPEIGLAGDRMADRTGGRKIQSEVIKLWLNTCLQQTPPVQIEQ